MGRFLPTLSHRASLQIMVAIKVMPIWQMVKRITQALSITLLARKYKERLKFQAEDLGMAEMTCCHMN